MDRRSFLASTAGALGFASAPALGQSFPQRPIRLVVPFPPGGGTDIVARVIAEGLGARLGQNIVVDNRPGANGVIAGEIVARAPADGHTILVATAATFAAAPALGAQLPYDVARDFAPVAIIGLFPLVLNVHPSLPAQNVQEFFALARTRPGALNYASAGQGGTNHIVMELISQKAGISLTHVPYRGAAPAQQDLISGQVQVMVDSLAASAGSIRAGRVRALAVTTERRQPALPELPTFVEQGFDFIYPSWAGIAAPAGTPPEIVRALNRAISAVQMDEATGRRYRELAIEPVDWDEARAARHMADDRASLVELVRRTGIRME